ncbi:hypothetical protein ColTof3_12208 [Colletotrichum tofieldiae]|nr:hypothetical protein ColTof3_12208 [Colletotrichum tofieldiae]
MFSRETIRDPIVRAVNKTGGDKVERNARIGAFMAEEDFLTRRLIDPLGKSSRLDTHTGLAHSALEAFDAQWTNASRDYKRRRVSPRLAELGTPPKSRDPTAPDPVSPEQWAGFGGAPFLAPASALSRPPSTTDTVAPQLLESPENTGRKVEIEDDDNDNDDALFRTPKASSPPSVNYRSESNSFYGRVAIAREAVARQTTEIMLVLLIEVLMKIVLPMKPLMKGGLIDRSRESQADGGRGLLDHPCTLVFVQARPKTRQVRKRRRRRRRPGRSPEQETQQWGMRR